MAGFLAFVATLLSLNFASVSGWANQPTALESSGEETAFSANEYLAEAARFTLPFRLIDGLPVIDGRVNGIEGKFLFDTGTHFAFFLNNQRLPLAKDTYLTQGTTASGQEVVLYSQDEPIALIELADTVRFENARSLPHTDWSFVEQGLVERFLGTVGYGFNRNYLFVVDYDSQIIDFYALNQDEATLATVFSLDDIIATLDFVPTNDNGNIPQVNFTIQDEAIAGIFDTGDHGTLTLTTAMKTRLEQMGRLSCAEADFLYGVYEPYTRCSLRGLQYGEHSLADLHNLHLKIGEENQLVLGYQFLKNYVSAWNYSNRTITLLKRR